MFYLSLAVNRTSFIMTNNMSLFTRHLWLSLHTTSLQCVVRVCICLFPYCYTSTFLNTFLFSLTYQLFEPFSFSTKKSATVGCSSMQGFNWILIAALGKPRWSMCSLTGIKKCSCFWCIIIQQNLFLLHWVQWCTCLILTTSKFLHLWALCILYLFEYLFLFCQKHLILLIKGLCTGCSRLDRTEIITFTAMMKSAKLPQTVKTLSDGKLGAAVVIGLIARWLSGIMHSKNWVSIPSDSGGSQGVTQCCEPRASTKRSSNELL